MNEVSRRFWSSAQWLSRLALLPPIVIFALIAAKYIAHPIESGAALGISFHNAVGATVTRVGFGAFPLGCSLFLLICWISENRLLTGLGLVAIMDSIELIVSTVGMRADSSVQQSMKLVNAEIVLLIIISAGLFVELKRHAIVRAQVRT